MAAVYGMQLAKHKSVYGKKGARGYNTSHVNSFFNEDDNDELASAQPTLARPATLKSTYTVQKTEAKEQPRTLKPVKPRIKRQDTFDVPSSSEDDISPPTKRVAPLKPRSIIADDTDTSGVQLMPWEKRRQQTPPRRQSPFARRQRTPEGSPEAQLKQELRQATLSPPSSPRTPTSKDNSLPTISNIISPDSGAELKATGAAARLAARRKLLESNAPSSADERTKPARTVPKRSVMASDESDGTPRKRPRPTTGSQDVIDDVHMVEAEADTMHVIVPHRKSSLNEGNIYDFPESSDDELKKSKPILKSPNIVAKPGKRTKLQTYKRSSIKKGISAPSRLTEMIATDTDTTEPSTRSPSESPSFKSASHQPSTPPPSSRINSPDTAVKATGTMTPKQAQLWDRLLPGNAVAPSPSALAMRELTISGERRKAVPVPPRRLSKSQSDIPKRRRLVDRLKASAPSSDAEIEDDETDDTDMLDAEGSQSRKDVVVKETSATHRPQMSRSQSLMESQSQSQSQPKSGKGNIRTYANVRSHLNDSIDDIVLDFTTESTQPPKPASQFSKKQSQTSQKSTFDLDDSDADQPGNSQMRTIHDLRAAGSLSRGMWEIEEALEEIRQRGQTQRGRRRNALMDLATKLADKTFTARFVGQSCELQLAAECGAGSDEIADFIVAAAIALIMASEPSAHAVQGLQEQGVVTWLAQLLSHDVEAKRLARDRKNNMAKASQMSLIQFCDMIKSLPSLWEEDMPQTMSSRLIALKALDQITRRLRQQGDKSEILPTDAVDNVLRDSDIQREHSNEVDLALSISVLESLSTASLSLEWSTSTMEKIRSLLPNLKATSPMMRKAQFLMLRLCLNLTNENERNCALLTGLDDTTVHLLLETIKSGYERLAMEIDDEERTVALDLLVLTIGIMINLAEHCHEARHFAVSNPEQLGVLLDIFQLGQKHMLDAESVEESISNVTFGYLAVMLANFCQNVDAKAFIASKLPGQNLGMLVEAVEEFVRHHQKVDTMNFAGEEGGEVWGAFTEKLRVVLMRLKEVEGAAIV